MSLKTRIIERIKTYGPMSVAEYMTLCLLDPTDGYYPTRDPLGSDGDFITAPEISQMFGEVLGLWMIQSWKDMGSPDKINLVEFGPGRGIMMADILRSARLAPAFFKGLTVYLIEASAALEAVQAQTLGTSGVNVQWVKDLSDVPSGPTLIIGNEYLDCLPIRQLIQKDRFAGPGGWHERLVTLDDEQRLSFAVAPEPISPILQSSLPAGHAEAVNDDMLEVCPAVAQTADMIAERFQTAPGRALFIDYGPEVTEFGDTLQALKRHEKVGVFSDPGNTDLTARVDFAALSDTALAAGLAVSDIVPQSMLLSKLGIEVRAVTLARSKPNAKAKLARQLERLTGADQMGQLFKAVCLQSPDLPVPLGFSELRGSAISG